MLVVLAHCSGIAEDSFLSQSEKSGEAMGLVQMSKHVLNQALCFVNYKDSVRFFGRPLDWVPLMAGRYFHPAREQSKSLVDLIDHNLGWSVDVDAQS